MKHYDSDVKGLIKVSLCILVTFLILLLAGCGTTHKVKGSTTHTAVMAGQVDVNIVLKIDLSPCDEFYYSDKLDCIEAITGTFESLGDLSKILVCDPKDKAKCDLLEKILGEVK